MSNEGQGPLPEHPGVDPALMADARARIRARWRAPEVIVPPGDPKPPRKMGVRSAALALAALALIGGALLVNSFGGETTEGSAISAQSSGQGYVPGVITPPSEPTSSSSSSSSSAPPSTTSSAGETKQAAGPPTFSGTAGPGCGGFTGVGSYRDGREGWVDHSGNCGQAFVSIPMSGDPRKDDPTAHGLWTFNTGPVGAGTCALSVFIPNGDLEDVGGNPTSYRVYDGGDIKAAEVGAFDIKQVDQRGKWVSVGSYRVSGGKLTVQLLTRGQDWDRSGPTFAHHAASAVKADCRA